MSAEVFISDQNERSVVDTLIKPQIRRPRNNHVVFLNDDVTPMDFVVQVLKKFFHKPLCEAIAIMLEVHHNGPTVAGTYTYEIAEQKMCETMDAAVVGGFPLQLILEEEVGNDGDDE